MKERKERPIIFNAQMVNAILDGRKTQTRRPITTLLGRRNGRIKEFQQSYTKGYDWTFRNRDALWSDIRHERLLELCPFGQVGDRLYVREAWRLTSIQYLFEEWEHVAEYKADEVFLGDAGDSLPVHVLPDDVDIDALLNKKSVGWIPSIHMPKWASRITLEITGVRIERVLEISEKDAIAEGMTSNMPDLEFFVLWESIYGAGNFYVWVIEFKRVGVGE